MFFGTHSTTYRKWMLTVFSILLVSVVLFLVQIKIPKGENLKTVGWTDPTPKNTLKPLSCLPTKNIVFLKTHKTASSSVQNILLRYADEHGLIVAVPADRHSSVFSLTRPFQKDMATGVPWEELGFNILCHHMVFNAPVLKLMMPEDSLYISIVRDPVRLFESLYEYSELNEVYKMDIEEYARSTKNASLVRKLEIRSNGMGRNQMLHDFGVRPLYFNNPEKLRQAIERLDPIFHFVMIAEYFDESVVILRHILCWELDDVVSLTINARTDDYKKNLSAEAAKDLREWNWGDQMLYEHFLRRFQLTLDEIGKRQVESEVEEVRRRRREWLDYCVQEKVQSGNLTAYKIWSTKVAGYKIKPGLKNQTCENLVKPEVHYTAEIRQKQLVKSLLRGAKIPSYGPKSLSRLIDLKYLKGRDYEVARRFLEVQYKYNKKRFFIMKEKAKT